MKIPHVHAEVIKAWAEGYTIQARIKTEGKGWFDAANPNWNTNWIEYRVKPEPKPDSILLRRIELTMGKAGLNAFVQAPNVKFTFDGETDTLKSVEMIDA